MNIIKFERGLDREKEKEKKKKESRGGGGERGAVE